MKARNVKLFTCFCAYFYNNDYLCDTNNNKY